ncbi:hypothetical protein CC1G_06208 [Coprinopsis cinerea okayama7|uniref:Uncharacterized protein n=1 Tax=Coprinopsis cinerea (strain Okayama-7 / 130 / ATCC MYA-4618 / FGSC 9003) TaxID=240176 RepID=A8NV81_COPC7|nr:hypothetical protein CC1G_06208 [Coprinopsis cinerea okayama7\|eukprot:XP_001836621.2 hypothetical protein CC1G_06208 [Coprinopsis cinerea okayama7\
MILATVLAGATQTVLGASSDGIDCHQSTDPRGSSWRFDQPLSNTTSNFIFDGVSSLLQQWGNTRYRNGRTLGHNIVPGVVPIGTLLYHGTSKNVIPSTPEWVATDHEHSHIFCKEITEAGGCWMLTLAVKRPLKVLYFDGSSSAKVYGTMDTQDLIIRGFVDDRMVWEEEDRIRRLCDWGTKYGLHGFIIGSEIMLCDFTNGLDVVSFNNITPPWPYIPYSPHPPILSPPAKSRSSILLAAHRLLESGHWHNRYPGETRVKLDLSGLVSLYDPELFPDLQRARKGQDRWEHRVGNITSEKRNALLARLDEVLSRRQGQSGVDWSSIFRAVIHRYAERLEVLHYMTSATPRSRTGFDGDIDSQLRDVHEYVSSMLAPYILNKVRPPSNRDQIEGKSPHSWAIPVFEACATTHTKGIAESSLTRSEVLLFRAVNDVLRETCRVLVGIWAQGAEIGLDKKRSPPELHLPADGFLEEVAESWSGRLDSLMGWLDWSVWVKCKPGCSFEFLEF